MVTPPLPSKKKKWSCPYPNSQNLKLLTLFEKRVFANAVKDLESRLSGLKSILNPVTSPGKGRERKQILPHRKGHVETSVKVRAEIKLCFHKPRTTNPLPTPP